MNADLPIWSLPPEDARGWLRTRLSGAAKTPLREAGAEQGALTSAAVLVPLVFRKTGVTVLLTRRAAHLNDHPGQISFPGGRTEPGDASPEATALRETFEEIGLVSQHVEVVGVLPDYCTGTGFRVTPVVGVVSPPFELALDAWEVDEAFEVPLEFLMDASNHQLHRHEIRGQMREYVAMPWGEYFIWGATAGMLVALHRVLRG